MLCSTYLFQGRVTALGFKLGLSFWLGMTVAAAASAQPKISECFKVYNLIKMDEDHYWANWANGCPYTIDSVYVMVRFSDHQRSRTGNGVWALHFVVPGTHQVTRFTAPRSMPDFDVIQVRKITTDSLEALLEEPGDRIRTVSLEAERTGDPGPRSQLAADSKAAIVSAAPVPDLPAVPVVVNTPVEPAAPATPKARVVLDEGPSTEPVSAEEHHRRGRALLQEGQYAAAIEELSRAIRAQPDWSLVYNARGFAYYLEHDYQHALADLDEAIRLNPQYLNAYQNRSQSRKAAGDSQGSAADSRKVRALLGTP